MAGSDISYDHILWCTIHVAAQLGSIPTAATTFPSGERGLWFPFLCRRRGALCETIALNPGPR